MRLLWQRQRRRCARKITTLRTNILFITHEDYANLYFNNLSAPVNIGTLGVLEVISHRGQLSIFMGSDKIGRQLDAVSLTLFSE